MFRHVPKCSGMFRVPGFIDAPGSYDQALTVSCIVTQFARKSFWIGRFRSSCMREYDLIL